MFGADITAHIDGCVIGEGSEGRIRDRHLESDAHLVVGHFGGHHERDGRFVLTAGNVEQTRGEKSAVAGFRNGAQRRSERAAIDDDARIWRVDDGDSRTHIGGGEERRVDPRDDVVSPKCRNLLEYQELVASGEPNRFDDQEINSEGARRCIEVQRVNGATFDLALVDVGRDKGRSFDVRQAIDKVGQGEGDDASIYDCDGGVGAGAGGIHQGERKAVRDGQLRRDGECEEVAAHRTVGGSPFHVEINDAKFVDSRGRQADVGDRADNLSCIRRPCRVHEYCE